MNASIGEIELQLKDLLWPAADSVYTVVILNATPALFQILKIVDRARQELYKCKTIEQFQEAVAKWFGIEIVGPDSESWFKVEMSEDPEVT